MTKAPQLVHFLIVLSSFVCKQYNRFCSTSVMKAEEDDQFKQHRQVPIHLKFDAPKFQKYLAAISSKGR